MTYLDRNQEQVDIDTFIERYKEIRLQVRMYIRHQFRDSIDHDEIVDSVMEKLFVQWSRIKDPLAWAIRAAKNSALDELRRASAGNPMEIADAIVMPPSTVGVTEQKLHVDAIFEALQRLPVPEQKTLILSAVGFTNSEIAHITGLSQNSVAHYLYLARKKLEKTLSYRRRKRVSFIRAARNYHEPER